MKTYALTPEDTAYNFVAAVHETDEPILVFDGEDECLVAMTPAAFERILFEGEKLAQTNRLTMRL